jgi:hypothetical protein
MNFWNKIEKYFHVASPASENEFLGAGDGVTRFYKLI